ncbi:MAG: PAS domain S-box protein, partial [Proteobacteria bacterium]|nr:PAS domain S-box protein [Pseudomonadota bacterium]
VDTEKAFREALSKKPDLILADYKLPFFSGLAALEIRRKLAADIPSILVSGTIGEEAAVECMKSGATDYVLKDRLSRLVPVVKRALKEAEEQRARKQAEEALRESEEKYRLVSENIPVVVYSALPDEHSTNLLVSGRVEELTGYNYQEFINNPELWGIIIYPEDSDYVWEEMKKHRKKKILFNAEYRIVTKNKKIKWIRDVATPILDENGKLIRIDGYMEDITARKQAEEALRESEGRLKTILSSIQAGIVVINAETHTIVDANPAAIEMIGAPEEEIIGHVCHKYICPAEKGKCPITDFGQEVDNSERTLLTANGKEIPILKTVTPTLLSGQAHLLDIFIDITEKKKLEAQLLQAQKMEAIGILAGGVAHDFNNILTAILGYTDLAMMKVDEADPLYRDLKQIDLSATRAASLTRQLLLFSRRQPIQFTSFNLNTTVDNLLKMLQRLIGEDITINTELDSELWTVQADAGNIEQAIMNLTVNARDAMPEGGTLTIKTENMHVDEDYCKTYTYAHPGKFVCLSVQDNGVGMDKEIIDSIFEPFFTTKGPGKGTGMGLSVVYGIVKQHEGWVNVYSEPGLGSNLKIYLPASSLKAEKETKETVSLKELKGSGERILLVEDEEEVREFATMVLGENGYVVYDAANAEEALDMFDKEAGNFNLIFSDVVLPGKTGIQLADQLLALKGELRILLSSGYTDHKSQWPVIRERGFRFLQKPYGLTDLLRAIREAIEQDK